jgi:hypothetical protein
LKISFQWSVSFFMPFNFCFIQFETAQIICVHPVLKVLTTLRGDDYMYTRYSNLEGHELKDS